MPITRHELRAQLKRREIAPFYVLFGPETYVRDVAAKTIGDLSFGAGDFRDFNETSFSLNADGNLEMAFAAARQLPMMASRRVVKIIDVRISASGYRDTVTEADEPAIRKYLDEPSVSSVVILVADELNGNRKMGKLLRAGGTAVEFAPLSEPELADWARAEFEKASVSIDPPTLRHFLSQVRPDVRLVTNEAKKLATAAVDDRSVTRELVDKLVPRTRETDHFELTDLVVSGRRSEAMACLQRILDDGAEPLALLGLIASGYRQMAKGSRFRNIDPRRLDAAVRRIAETDLAIKTSIGGSGPTAARMNIEILVAELSAA